MTHQTLSIRTADGNCPAHVFTPDGDGPWPGVLVYIDGVGMRPAMHEIGARLATAGYYVLMPDLFYRMGPYAAPDPAKLFSDEAVRADWWKRALSAVSPDKTMSDTTYFLQHLAAQANVRPPRVGVTGYCMGGRMALVAAARFPDRIAAVAAYHPGGLVTDAPDSPHLGAPRIKARVYVAGASEDPNFTDEHKRCLEEALRAAGVDHVVETYAARHGWVPSDLPVHDDAAAERHWRTLIDLFDRTLES